jgi:glutathione S-transferase
MALTLHLHPLASFCWKALIALYENDTPFEPVIVDLSDAEQRAALERLWPVGKFPVLVDGAAGQTIPESSLIIEYLARHHPGRVALVPDDPDAARDTRLWDRFFDLYLHQPMQKVVLDKLRPPGASDPFGVAHARAEIERAYAIVDQRMAARAWAMGDAFTMADCAAAPAMYYANRVQPIGSESPSAAVYLKRLVERPSMARVLKEAEPYFASFPG